MRASEIRKCSDWGQSHGQLLLLAAFHFEVLLKALAAVTRLLSGFSDKETSIFTRRQKLLEMPKDSGATPVTAPFFSKDGDSCLAVDTVWARLLPSSSGGAIF